MGLDMYLTKKIYIGAEYEHRNVKGEATITIDNKPVKINFNRISYIEEAVGYWRKANHIHAWFVQNVQDGEDDCKQYYVGQENLQELLDTCKKVKENPTQANCEKLLPTQGGFFFGATTYAESYMQAIDYTIQLIEDLIKNNEFEGADFYYKASW